MVVTTTLGMDSWGLTLHEYGHNVNTRELSPLTRAPNKARPVPKKYLWIWVLRKCQREGVGIRKA